MRRTLHLAIAALAVACGPSTAPQAPAAPPAGEVAMPALRWVPADAAYVVATGRVGDAIALAREVLTGVGAAHGADLTSLDGLLRAELGFSPVDADALADLGIDLEGSAALFGNGSQHTLVVALDGVERTAAFLDDRRPEVGVSITQYRGREVYSQAMPGGARLSWSLLDGWLLVHVDADELRSVAWLDPILAAAEHSIAAEEDFARALARAGAVLGAERGASPAVVGLVRVARLAADLAGVDDRGLACLASLPPVVRSIAVGGAVGWDFADGYLEVGLAPAAAAAVKGALAAPPPAGFLRLREEAGLFASWSLDLGWLAGVVEDSCLAGVLSFEDPMAAMLGWTPPPAAYHLAASHLDPAEPAGQVAAHVALRDRRFLDRQLDAIPARALFDRSATIAGTAVRVLGVPGYPKLYYHLTDASLTAAVGADWMARLVGQEQAILEHAELGAFGLRPSRIGDLEALAELALGLDRMGRPGGARVRAEAIAKQLRRLDHGSVRLVLDGDRLRLRGSVARRP